jgi:hypothetical protein
MPDKQAHTPQSLPVSNYSSAIARAVEWLGDRYLLAKPINSDMRPRAPSALEHPHRIGTSCAASEEVKKSTYTAVKHRSAEQTLAWRTYAKGS